MRHDHVIQHFVSAFAANTGRSESFTNTFSTAAFGVRKQLFVNDRTLFNFILPDVSRAQIRALPELFHSGLSCVISAEEFPEDVQRRILEEYEGVALAKSSDRSVLGSSSGNSSAEITHESPD